MTSSDPQVAPAGPPRRRARLFVPFALLAVLAAVWTGFWFFAASKAGEAVDVWLKREADRGRVYACANRSVGGYPFRLEVDCEAPTARFASVDGPVVASAPRFVAVAQVYDPKRLIGDLTGPVAVTMADGSRSDLSFGRAQASLLVEGRRFERCSIVMATPRLVAAGDEIGAARELQLHLRRTPDAADGAYDVAVRLEDAVSPLLDLAPVGEGPASLLFQVQAQGLGDLEPGPLDQRLRAFAEAGGRLKVELARVERGGLAAEAAGDAALDVEGRLRGTFDVTARGVDDVIQRLLGGGRKDTLSALLGAGASMLGAKAELDGQPARTYRVTIDKGRLSVGPIKLMRLPPLF
ncbi:DUF2125 domain-containing protein [Hansschlegelia sp. KR7-227]|uniref:DUF2125 domain-containing protein n=1 Tax=Hansschlegelia sp. KR7-227 TaxID=3400914 RepID=UPI003C022FB8